jgi:hypothetical protein
MIGRRDHRQQRLLCGVTGEVDCFRTEYHDGQNTAVRVMVLVVVVKQFG